MGDALDNGRGHSPVVDGLIDACLGTLDSVQEIRDHDERWRALKWLQDVIQATNERVRRQRSEVATAIYERDRLSLRTLAEHLAISPARADQLVNGPTRKAKKAKKAAADEVSGAAETTEEGST